MVFGLTPKSTAKLCALVQDHEKFQKEYLAVIAKPPAEKKGEMRDYLYHDKRLNKAFPTDGARKGSKEAVLNYRVLGCSTRYTLVEVELLTGRHHQIRAQLSKIGCPIKGDLKYGAKRSNPDGGISLHSRRVEFVHPVKREPVSITAPAPKDNLWEFFETM